MAHIATWVLGFVLATGVAIVAWRIGSLTVSGAAAAILVGTLAMAAGWDWGIVLIVYFGTTTLVSRFRAAEKSVRLEGRIAKSGSRDAVQVFANGGVFAVAAFAYAASVDELWRAVAAGALAASAADTWATEIGTLSGVPPRSILTGRPAVAGSSGAVTLVGFLAGLVGAAIIAVLALAAGWPSSTATAALLGGLAGSLVDSVLGASVQARRWCERCDAQTEQRTHRCGSPTIVTGGISWIDNDGVNTVCTLAGGLLGAAVVRYL